MWKLTTSLMFLEGGVVASVVGEYVPNVGEHSNYLPLVLQRVFVKKEEAVEWVVDQMKFFDIYTKDVEGGFNGNPSGGDGMSGVPVGVC